MRHARPGGESRHVTGLDRHAFLAPQERPAAPHHDEDLLLGHVGVPREGLLAGGDHLAPEADRGRAGRPTEVLLAPPEPALLPRLFRHLAHIHNAFSLAHPCFLLPSSFSEGSLLDAFGFRGAWPVLRSQKAAWANFAEYDPTEVRRVYLPRTRVNNAPNRLLLIGAVFGCVARMVGKLRLALGVFGRATERR